ncbi:MAG TPA: hypothetical protein VF317_01935, partial [Dermatophilaceae bacterium]
SGYVRGLQEARRLCGATGATVLIVSDGHANAGVTDPVQLSAVAAHAQRHGITTTTSGSDWATARCCSLPLPPGGAGNHKFADGTDDTGPVIAEIDGLLTKSVQAASP